MVRSVEGINRRQALWLLAAITMIGAAFRFYNLAWGAPYYHFHIDEHFIFGPADMLRRDPHAAAMSPKFFMYSPLMMYLINIARWAYEALFHPLDLTVPRDEVTYMVLGRSISAAFGTATIPIVYAIGTRVSGRGAGLLAAVFLACGVLHLRDSHFATTDMSMTFFCVLALWFSLRIAERGDIGSLLGAGAALGGAVLSKYSGAFVLGIVGLAYLLSPRRPTTLRPIGRWIQWGLRGTLPIVVGVATFLVLNPLVLQHFDKFRADIREQITEPLLGVSRPIWIGHFADLALPELYWFTNLLLWGLGPALEVLGLGGVVWLLMRRQRQAGVVAAFPIIYFAIAGRSIAPFARYAIPLVPALAVAAGAVAADWMGRRPRQKMATGVAALTVTSTVLYAFAYMNVFRQPDSRLEASYWLVKNVLPDSKILVEPSHNIPPTGSYLTAMDFNRDYVLWGGRTLREAQRERNDFYHLYTLDTYVFLYGRRYSDEERRAYIASRLAQVDWIVMDDTFLQFYQHLSESENGVVKQYYRDLFAGSLGFGIVKSFKVYPAILGWTINDDGAELTFRLFDHPRVFIFKRNTSGQVHERLADPPRGLAHNG